MKEIGEELSLSVRTVESHKYEMMETLDVHSTTELVKYAMEHATLGIEKFGLGPSVAMLTQPGR
jgi:DNA-binding NarL/FixJ family response regulator